MTEDHRGEDVAGTSVDCIVLAAGASSRMGRPKLHLPLGASTVLAATVDAALGAGLRVIIVGRPDDPLIVGYARPRRVLIAINPKPERGMLSSLRVGLAFEEREVPEGAPLASRQGFFFVPGDMPLVGTSTYKSLLRARHEGPVIATFRGRRGHPVFMPEALRAAVLALPYEGNLRALIDASGPLFVETDDEGTVTDIDLPAEYESAAARRAEPFSSSCIPRVGA
ncbi:MAG TPA: NTP transferase domain-containing protein [Rectinemataceae bacterium]|nr:NTP transferase domain-containing protein [Rectinemataceae bacterium]